MSKADDYQHQAQQLLPLGDAWTRARESDSVLGRLFGGLALTFSRIDDRVVDLLNEARPRTAVETLSDWEAEFGLPDSCLGIATSIADRQLAVWAKQTAIGGQDRQYFIDQALKLGFTISIEEFTPFSTESTTEDLIYDESWAFGWRVHVLADAGTGFNLGCVLNRDKPAHTVVLFA